MIQTAGQSDSAIYLELNGIPHVFWGGGVFDFVRCENVSVLKTCINFSCLSGYLMSLAMRLISSLCIGLIFAKYSGDI